MEFDDNSILVGHANSFHDQALAVVRGDQIYAEAVERLLQSKRALGNVGLMGARHGLAKAFARFGFAPATEGEVVLRSTWDFAPDALAKIKKVGDFLLTRTQLSQKDQGNVFFRGAAGAALDYEPFLAPHLSALLAGDGQWPGGIGTADYPQMPVRFIPTNHHLCHAANAVFTSPYTECAVMVLDGNGEDTCASYYHFKDNDFQLIYADEEIKNSLGLLYGAVTALCGWDWQGGDQWKVMGLAAYGKPRDDIREFFASRTVQKGLRCELGFEPGWTEKLESIVGGYRKPGDDVMRAVDLAHNFQRYTADVIVGLAAGMRELNISDNLAYSGGVALNSSANGEIVPRTGFASVHIPSAPADDGNALGAALYEKYVVRKAPRPKTPIGAYLGSDVDLREIEHIVSFEGFTTEHHVDPEALCTRTAGLLAGGAIVGWMQGRAEFGPRALGNRSILADPRAPDMKAKINKLVKFREWYRPVAPSILHEFGDEYFENYQESPFMERALRFRPEVRERVPAVVHEDGTGRHQTVKDEWNPLYARLLRAFHRVAGVPILVNTSLNVMGKPIVHSVADAITVFATTGLHHLVVGPYILSKRAV